MKIKIILTAAFLLTLIFKNSAQENTATLDETIEFIEGKLQIFDAAPPAPIEYKAKYNKLTKILEVKVRHLATDFKKESFFLYEIPITKINPDNIQITETYGVYGLYLYTNNNADVISERFYYNGEDPKKIKPFMVSKMTFKIPADEVVKNPNLPERLKKAFIHLIKLTGGKGEKF